MTIAFYIAAGLTIFFVIAMIFQKNPVTSAVFLVLSFFSLAGIYVTLDAHFIAALQILVYAGAVMVLFVFVIMLLNLKPHELDFDRIGFKALPAFLVSGVFLALLIYLIGKIPHGPEVQFAAASAEFGTAKAVGKLMLTDYVLPFEVMGVLLTVGLIGAVLLGRRD